MYVNIISTQSHLNCMQISGVIKCSVVISIKPLLLHFMHLFHVLKSSDINKNPNGRPINKDLILKTLFGATRNPFAFLSSLIE